jgi:inner membrane protein
MDSLTHIVAGACIGEIALGKKIGRKAMLWGALAQSIPDIDFVAGLWMDTAHELVAHRGFTHSFLFAGIASFFLAMVAEKWHRPHNISMERWIGFFLFEILTHLFLDAFNNYGVGWFEPFSEKRISFNTIYVADPFFSIAPGICFLVLLFMKKKYPQRRRWAMAGLWIPILYLGYAVINKLTIDLSVREMAQKQQISYNRYFTTPAALNSWLWFIVLEDSSGYHVGYRSVFDRKKELELGYFPRNMDLLTPVNDHVEVQLLKKFSQGFYTLEKWNDTLVFNDLRFGQIIGWEKPREHFVFHYFLTHPEDNQLVVQRGRFAKWNRATPGILINRIKGN